MRLVNIMFFKLDLDVSKHVGTVVRLNIRSTDGKIVLSFFEFAEVGKLFPEKNG